MQTVATDPVHLGALYKYNDKKVVAIGRSFGYGIWVVEETEISPDHPTKRTWLVSELELVQFWGRWIPSRN